MTTEAIYTCRICYEELKNRDLVICPCKCSGGSKYVCKSCLNEYMTKGTNENKYTTCPTCKTQYDRQKPEMPLNINDETRDEMIYAIASLTLLSVMFLFFGKFTFANSFFALVLYFYSLCLLTTTANISMIAWGYWAIFAIFLSVLWLTPKYSYIVYSLWIIGLLILESKWLLEKKWDNLNERKFEKLLRELGCKMFDFELNQYIAGLL